MTNPETTTRGWRRFARPGVLALGLAAVLVGAGGLAWAAGAGPAALGHGFCKAGHFREMAEFKIHRALKQVGASEAQEEQILAILDTQIARHKQMAGVREELHARIEAALTGDTVDRAALEAVRVEALQHLDAGSKELVKAVADAAEVLTPAQRRQLAEIHKERFE